MSIVDHRSILEVFVNKLAFYYFDQFLRVMVFLRDLTTAEITPLHRSFDATINALSRFDLISARPAQKKPNSTVG